MNQWVQHPLAHTALDDILPCVDNATAQETLTKSKEVTSKLVDVVNQVITNISNNNFSPSFRPLYYNQSGPKLPMLCNPFYSDLTDRSCSPGEVDLSNATKVHLKTYSWKVKLLQDIFLYPPHVILAKMESYYNLLKLLYHAGLG